MMMHAQSASSGPAAPYIGADVASSTRASPSFGPLHQPHAKRQRYSSRSNSVSGSSVTTVQRAASRSSSQTGTSGNGYSGRSQSPGDTSLASLRQGNGSATQSSFLHARRKSATFDHQDHPHGTSADAFNRWSQSTDSSMSSAKRHQHSNSGTLLSQAASGPLSPPRHASNHASEHSPRLGAQQTSTRPGSRQRLTDPVESPERLRVVAKRPGSRGNPLNALPVLQTAVPRSDAESDSPSTASTGIVATSESITPSTQSSYATEYFASNNASPRGIAQPNRPSTMRTATAPMTSLNYSRMPRAEDVKESAHIRRRSEHLSNLERDSKMLRPMATTAGASEERNDRPRARDRSEREKKAMLAKALEKANTAVVLDNKQNFIGALDAYNDACMLLQQVMDRSVNPADRRKLEAIKVTYTNRIEELKLLEETQDEADDSKELPERPQSDDSLQMSPPYEPPTPMDAHMQDAVSPNAPASDAGMNDVPRLAYPEQDQGDFFSRTMADVERVAQMQDDVDHSTISSRDNTSVQNPRALIVNQRVSKLPPPEETRYLPAPLTTRKQPSPTSPMYPDTIQQEMREESTLPHSADANGTQDNGASNTWLDTIDESSGSSTRSSSVHSVSSRSGVRRKPLQTHTAQSNADLDAAFDAAVEAAYDEGFEPDLDSPQNAAARSAPTGHVPASADITEIISPTAETFGQRDPFARTAEDDEDERILDEFSNGYGHGFNFGLGSKSALPRQSDSSGYSRSTWQSSQASERATAGTSLSTVAENDSGHISAKSRLPSHLPVSHVNVDSLPPSAPPPNAALPAPPKPEQLSGSTVRNRRLSGQNAKELKIETAADPIGRKRASTIHDTRQSLLGPNDFDTDTHKEVSIGAPLEPSPSDVHHERMLKSPPSLDLLSLNHRALTPTDTIRSADDAHMGSQLYPRPNLIRKNQSSLSLRADHTVLLPSPGLYELGDATPLSATFTLHKSNPLTSQRAALHSFSSPIGSSTSAGTYLFDTQLLVNRGAQSPRSPGEGPTRLEPCPEALMLRPFWLMRSLGSTITHSRGGFVTTKLFVPREVWQTRGVKLRNVDDKVANCDLLTAALGQLSEVDTFDADAVMDELQRFEEVMERVQTALAKKLGGEVGVHGVGALFKDAPLPGTNTVAAGCEADKGTETFSGSTDKNAKSHSSKGYLSSWRKLRSKSSGAPTAHGGAAAHIALRSGAATGDKDARQMASVPMTNFVPVERRGQKRDMRNLSFDGPNREYMSSLARLFQAVQVLDQIARQVEDPGLKHSSPTHVGLELSIRHAAEFFSFYVCRFVLADLSILIDKFVKRGTEWVMM